ncbi:M13 family metallopeptidase [Piscinibacter sakaiensis]|uniref:M13 family metallopeptidase n=1 Tax=Piscinibacter sakaiensis TaxID=1547922 RepID=UPI003AAA7FE3
MKTTCSTFAAAVLMFTSLGAVAVDRPLACTDFYDYVNADWEARTELPADRARIGSFDTLRIANDRLLQRSLERLVAEPALQDSPGLKKLSAFYASAIDPALAEQAGLRSLASWLDRIAALRDPAAELPALLGELTAHGVALPLNVRVGPDLNDVRRHALFIGQSGLGLPDRDDYLNDDATSRRLRDAYRTHAGTLLRSAGFAQDAATLDALMGLETALAKAAMNRIQRRDPQATANRRTLAALRDEASGFDWPTWFDAIGVAPGGSREFIVAQPEFVKAVARLTATVPASTWQTYLRVRLLDEMAPWLAAPYRNAHFDFHERTLRGLQTPTPRGEELIRLIGGRTGGEPMGLALGELFVREAFSPRAQQRALLMIEDIRSAMRTRIENLDWMSAATKARAQAKLAAMAPQIGAPTQWPTFDGLTLDPREPAGNALRVAAWGFRRDIADLGKPVDRMRWQTSPHIVNAFAGGLNRIVFPAGILQPPFFDADGDDAGNYGGIGMVIGHEIIHHFDDRGRQFDADGNLADWWAAADATAYRQRADRVVALYGGYEPLPGLRINGRQMLGENISDLGGMQIAFDAYKLALERQKREGRPAPTIDGRTPEQRFFIANAVIWRTKQRAQALEQQIRTGQHSPGPYRVRGPMSNMPAFAAAFGCRAGDPMVAGDPVAVW